jgi:limonene-1,2-epoxide hydrolase
MSPRPTAPIEVVHAFLNAMEKNDMDGALTFVSDNCEYTNPPPTGTVRGPAAALAVLAPLFAPVQANELIIKREAANGPVVIVERFDRHRFPTGWVELPVTGVFEVHGGKITVWRDYFDAATFQNAIAALPS